MPQLCLYLQLHQPYRLKKLSLFDVGAAQPDYFGGQAGQDDANGAVFRKVADKSYIPMLSLLSELLQSEPGFSCALSTSGVFLEQAAAYEPRVIKLLRDLALTGRVEFLAETYYHSLSSLYSPSEFRAQIKKHAATIKKLFGLTPRVFRNTELVYSNDIAKLLEPLNFAGVLTEGVDRYLHGRPRTKVFLSKASAGHRPLPMLLKHAQLSDDVAFRFSDRNWSQHPLSSEKYLSWVESYAENEIVNLFMDFETFGEHQWQDTGIFEFFRHFIHRFLERPWNSCKTPTQLFFEFADTYSPRERAERTYDVPEPISWADVDRDLTAWRDNALQRDTLERVYSLEKKVLASGDDALIDDWRRLQTSDHFYYMCIKWSQDGDVHAYFSPYDSPFEAYRMYTLALADLDERLLERSTWPAH